MDERIRQLAEQAGIEFTRVIPGSARPHVICSDESLMKFAMLVIQDYENDLREDWRGVKRELGFSRIGLKNG